MFIVIYLVLIVVQMLTSNSIYLSMEYITKENLINIVCRWMDYHNSDESYIIETSNGRKFINGRYQTDLRSFINDVVKSNITYSEAISKVKE